MSSKAVNYKSEKYMGKDKIMSQWLVIDEQLEELSI